MTAKLMLTLVCATGLLAQAQPGPQTATPLPAEPVARATPVETAKLPGDTLTLTEAKAFLQAHQSEKAKLEQARQAVFKQGAKATPEERAKLIGAFRTAQQTRTEQIRAQAARARELEEKIFRVEKPAAPPSGAPPTKG